MIRTVDTRGKLWEDHPGLVWSNRAAGDVAHIRAALLAPRFHQLCDIARVFGLDQLEREWKVLSQSGMAEAARAKPIAERCLGNLRIGLERASHHASQRASA